MPLEQNINLSLPIYIKTKLFYSWMMVENRMNVICIAYSGFGGYLYSIHAATKKHEYRKSNDKRRELKSAVQSPN